MDGSSSAPRLVIGRTPRPTDEAASAEPGSGAGQVTVSPGMARVWGLVLRVADTDVRRYEGGLDRVPDEVLERFHAYDWPGNVRELENLVRRLVVLKDPSMALGELPPLRAAPPLASSATLDDPPLKEVGKRAARIAERQAILSALMRTGWNKRTAALRLHISYKAVLHKIKDCHIVDPRELARAL